MKVEVCPGRETIVILDQEATGVAEYMGFTSQFVSVEVTNEFAATGKTWATRMLKFDTQSGAQRAVRLIEKKGNVLIEALGTDD